MKSNLCGCKYFGLVLLLVPFLFKAILSREKLTGDFTGARPRDVDGYNLKKVDSFSADERKSRPANSITSINIIGERHTASKFMTKHLQECFGDQIKVDNRYTRWKHWFQYDDDRDSEHDRNHHQPNSSLVIAMFRDPIDWVNAMRGRPYHSPNHFDLDWKRFVTTPWTMSRGQGDEELIRSGTQANATCMHRFAFNEIIPCSELDRLMYNGTYHGKTVGVVYELNHDGSGRPYDSIVDLRRDKIKNFLGVRQFNGVAAFLPIQFEYMATQGTSDLIREIENITELKANCKGAPPHPLVPKDLDPEFIKWMNANVDWEAEKLIGYQRRDSHHE